MNQEATVQSVNESLNGIVKNYHDFELMFTDYKKEQIKVIKDNAKK